MIRYISEVAVAVSEPSHAAQKFIGKVRDGRAVSKETFADCLELVERIAASEKGEG